MNNIKRMLLILLTLSILASCLLISCKKQEETSETEAESTEAETENEEETEMLTIYPEFDKRINRDYMYSVSVTQGTQAAALPVYNHATDDNMIRNTFDPSANEYRRFSTFAFDEAGGQVRVDIKVNCDFDSYSVLPSAKNFKNEFKDGVISVYLDKPEYFLIRLDGKDSTHLAVFADAPEVVPDAQKNIIVVEDWFEMPNGILELTRDNMILYIKPGAVLHARVHVKANNCKIIGRGMILDPVSNMYSYNGEQIQRTSDNSVIYVKNADNTVIDGIHMVNAFGFNITTQGNYDYGADNNAAWTENTDIDNVKILSSQLCSDGITFGYRTRNSHADNCFIYNGDNAVLAEMDAHFKNITVGTTCNAIFPQATVVGSTMTDIYVFRADEGIINQDYAEQNPTKIDYTITNLYANDVMHIPYVFRVENMTVRGELRKYPYASENGGAKISNFYLPELTSVATGYFYSSIDSLSGSNYEINMTNVSVNGKAVDNLNTDGVGVGSSIGSNKPITYSKDAGFDGSVALSNVTVNYKNSTNVFIGKQQIFFEHPVVLQDGVFMLPYDQILRELYATDSMNLSVDIDGVAYISIDSLRMGSMIKSADTGSGSLVITPKPYSGNLAVDNGGIASDFMELNPSHTYISTTKEGDSYVYTLKNRHSPCTGSGMGKMVDDEIRKFGAGTYKFTFSVKASKSGSVSVDRRLSAGETIKQSYDVSTSWTQHTFEFEVSEGELDQQMILLAFILEWGGTTVQVDIKDISLVKVN